MPREEKKVRRSNTKCRFCRDLLPVDYKDVETLSKLTSAQGKVLTRKRTGNCAKHQRAVKRAIKRSRYMALMPYVA